MLIFLGLGLFLFFLFGWPAYNVYRQEQAGRAALAEAQSSRQIAVLEARAKLESAKMLADAEVLRAEGAARANHILQNSLGGPDGYLRYLQVQAIDAKEASLIYVPTEGGLPLLESRRLSRGNPEN
ncbi:MAG: membrane protease subunit [Alphaproteobacteria bacterium]|nr:membrane protease subunit [Alphaproteobacteria bacterium]MBU0793181.1 membrane protease subunit [Alphaproteobacteria bacterium]MBU0876958.1 membrane protease subunit [Alphaproteobacteria bacterium]MBU1771047.1 membrane protease subunit [Alphaproteobacteria bacterium]